MSIWRVIKLKTSLKIFFLSGSTDEKKTQLANETQQFVASKNISWQFSLPKAPWYGGFWERLVGSVKRCLKKTIGKSKLSYVELQTILFEVENVLNNRPLCSVDDDNLEKALTPNDLLFGRQLNIDNILEKQHINDTNIQLSQKRLNYLENVLTHFCKR